MLRLAHPRAAGPARRPGLLLVLVPLLALAGACADDGSPPEARELAGWQLTLAPDGRDLTLTRRDLPSLRLAGLAPAIRLDGVWHSCREYPRQRLEPLSGAGPLPPGWRLRCSGAEPELPALRVELRPQGPRALEVTASAEGPVVGLEALAPLVSQGGVTLGSGPIAFLSNGYQSWSNSGGIRLPAEPPPAGIDPLLAQRDTDEWNRDGRYVSWWYGALAAADGTALVVGSPGARRFRPSVTAWGPPEAVSLQVTSGGAGERVGAAPGERIHAEPCWLAAGDDAWTLLREYAAALAGDAPPVGARPGGWNSWYAHFPDIDEELIREAARLTARRLTWGEPRELVVDDGWERSWGDWQPNARFPSGMPALAAAIAAHGLRPGLWLAPLLVEDQAPLAAAQPGWFVRDAAGAPLAYAPPLTGERYLVLDVTHPEVAAHLREVLARVVGWGFTSLKLDFLFVGAWEGVRQRPCTGSEAYAEALRVLREGMGPSIYFLACGAPLLAPADPGPDRVLPYQAIRTGLDIAYEFLPLSWSFVAQQLRATAARAFLQGVVLTVDPDPALVREPLTEAEAWSTVVATLVAGGAAFASDPLGELPEGRWALLTAPALAEVRSLPGPARPVDLLRADRLPERLLPGVEDFLLTTSQGGLSPAVAPAVWVWSTGAGAVVALFNLHPDPVTRRVDLHALGLDPDHPWSPRPLGPAAPVRLAAGALVAELAGHQALLVALSP